MHAIQTIYRAKTTLYNLIDKSSFLLTLELVRSFLLLEVAYYL